MALMTKQKALDEINRLLRVFGYTKVSQQPQVLTKLNELWDGLNKVKEYVKTIFKPAKNVSELKERYNKSDMLDNFDVSKNVKLATCNAGFKAMTEVTDRFEMSRPLSFFGSYKESPFRGSKISKGVYAIYARTRSLFSNGGNEQDGIIFPVGTDLEKIAAQKKYSNDRYNEKLQEHQAMIARNSNIASEVKEKAKQLTKWRWSVSESFEGTVHHEMGHMIHLRDDAPEIDGIARDNYRKGWASLISQYSQTNHKEYFAETFAAYMAGEHEFIEPKLLAVLKELDKAA